MRKSWWLAGVLLLLGGIAFVLFAMKQSDRHWTTHSTLNRAAKFVEACEDYRKDSAGNGRYPPTLLDLFAKTPDGKIFLDPSDSKLISPFGMPFRYAVIETEDGPVPYVWTEREHDGKVILVGAKGGPDGKAVLFGRPD